MISELIHFGLLCVLMAFFAAAASGLGVLFLRFARGQDRLYYWWPRWKEAGVYALSIAGSMAVVIGLAANFAYEHPYCLF